MGLVGSDRPIRVRELDHVVIRARDLERLVRFYSEVLGCPVERRVGKIGLVQLRAGRSLIDLIDAAADPPHPGGANMDHVCLRLEPFDPEAIREHLAGQGVPCGGVEQRYGAEGTGPSIYIEDPEGNTVELKGPPGPPA
jgi:catechol 2,3-dioxygenase-like lactoylglutathione lyase family enzyme